MKTKFFILLILSLTAVPIAAAGGAVAQENTTNATDEQTETESDTEPEPEPEPEEDESDDESTEIEANGDAVDELTGETQQTETIRVDDAVQVVGWGYDAEAEVFQIVFESDRARRVTLTESVQRAEGSGSFSVTTERLNSDGRTLVELPVPAAGGEAAVGITTSASLAEGGGTYLSTGISENRPSITWQSAQLLIIITAVGSAAGSIRYVKLKRDEEDKSAERWL